MQHTWRLAVESDLPAGEYDRRQLSVANCSYYIAPLRAIQRHGNDSQSPRSRWYRTIQTLGLRGRFNVPVDMHYSHRLWSKIEAKLRTFHPVQICREMDEVPECHFQLEPSGIKPLTYLWRGPFSEVGDYVSGKKNTVRHIRLGGNNVTMTSRL